MNVTPGIRLLKRVQKKIFKPKILKRLVTVDTRDPRIRVTAASPDDGNVTVLEGINHLDELSLRISSTWETCAAPWFNSEHRVLIKINLNTADPYPASTSPQMLSWLLDFLQKRGIRKILVGDCSSLGALPTKKVAHRAGILTVIDGRADFICFDKTDWITTPVKGRYLNHITTPLIVHEVDRIISLANLKAHRLATFSAGLKLGVGFMHPLERYNLHRDHLEEKVAEINLAVPPDLTIIDGRQAMISGGPITGQIENAEVIIIGTNPVLVDAEVCRRLHALKIQHGCLENFPADPYSLKQLQHGKTVGPNPPNHSKTIHLKP